MSDRAEVHLSRRERQILEVIYARGAASAADVTEGLPDPPSRTAVRTLLRILEEKGHVRHVKKGREFIYQPTRSRVRAGLSALRRVLATFFDDSMEKALATHLADAEPDLSDDELKRLAELIRRARGKGD